MKAARSAFDKYLRAPAMTIDEVFGATVERQDYQHATEQLGSRLLARLHEIEDRGWEYSDGLQEILLQLAKAIRVVLHQRA